MWDRMLNGSCRRIIVNKVTGLRSLAGLLEEKVLAREQWRQDRVAQYGRDHELGTRGYRLSDERHRYHEYAPWMPPG